MFQLFYNKFFIIINFTNNNCYQVSSYLILNEEITRVGQCYWSRLECPEYNRPVFYYISTSEKFQESFRNHDQNYKFYSGKNMFQSLVMIFTIVFSSSFLIDWIKWNHIINWLSSDYFNSKIARYSDLSLKNKIFRKCLLLIFKFKILFHKVKKNKKKTNKQKQASLYC